MSEWILCGVCVCGGGGGVCKVGMEVSEEVSTKEMVIFRGNYVVVVVCEVEVGGGRRKCWGSVGLVGG